MRALRVSAVAVAGLTVALFAVKLLQATGVLHEAPDGGVPNAVVPVVALAVFVPTLVGLAIALRQPRNVVAWIMLVGELVVVALPFGPAISDGWSLQIGRATWPLLYAWPIAVAFVFPDGRLLTPRWRWIAGGALVSFVGFTTIALLDPSPFDPPSKSVTNPLLHNAAGTALDHPWIWVPFWLGIFASLVAGAVAIRLRVRRSTGVARLQALWLAWSALLIPVALACCAATWLVFSWMDAIVFPLILLFQVAIAASIWFAITRHRLYSIERIVNRTLVYASLTVLLAVAYALLTVALGVAVGRSSEWATAGATLAVALAFRPLRSLVQNAVDRRFSRARWDAVRQVRAFEEKVREGRRAPEEIGAVLAGALGDARAQLFYWLPESRAYADEGGVVEQLPADGRARSEVGAHTAVLLHDPGLLDRRDLLDGVLAAAALSVEIARLRVELRLQLAEVQASGARIIEAGYEERRRLERDLHDGAQQRLVSLGLRLRRLQFSLPREARILSPALDQIVDEVGAAIADLRQIAAGVRPARLDDGLAAALQDLARSVPVPVEVDAPDERVAASVEAAAYFIACEGLTNAVKHASASRVRVTAARRNGALLVSVADDGVGGAVARRGSGLAGLRDRVVARGGTLEITSPQGGGTVIEAAIPCES